MHCLEASHVPDENLRFERAGVMDVSFVIKAINDVKSDFPGADATRRQGEGDEAENARRGIFVTNTELFTTLGAGFTRRNFR